MSGSATVAVDKATSDLLIGPDWTMNIDICDSINSTHWQAKDVVKAVKKRLLHKNPKVQLLSLTLLETMIKNCGDHVHFQIADRNILPEMVKIVRKKTDMQVRDKILDLLDSWQEAFGGPGGKFPQYYWAFEELRRSGVEFPKRERDAAPIFTPPATNQSMRHAQAGYGMPNNTSIRLDEAMASEMANLSLSNLDSMQSVKELLAEMLQAVNPNDREALNDEIIADLVSQCRSNQKKLMQMLTSTGDEELLAQGLTLNDSLQSLLVKHDAIASGSPLPIEMSAPSPSSERKSSGPRSTEGKDPSPRSRVAPASPISAVTTNQLEEDEEEDDDFSQLARRRSKIQVTPSQGSSVSMGESVASSASTTATPSTSNALALPDPPNPVRTSTKEQDMIDLLSITLSTTSSNSPQAPVTPPSTSHQATDQVSVSQPTQSYPYGSQPFPGYQGQPSYNNYVAPWAQPQPPYPQYSYNYPPPPWATNAVNSNQNPSSGTPTHAAPSYTSVNAARPNSFPARGNSGPGVYGEQEAHSSQQHATGPKPFVPSYRLFEDLNVLGKSDVGHKATNSSNSPTLSGMTGQSMVGGRK